MASNTKETDISYKILHVTPHLGGGVGSVVLNWLNKEETNNIHTVISLDINNNKDWIQTNETRDRVTIYNGCYFMENFREFFCKKVEENDIVLIHWWNHPLIYDLMLNHKWANCRVLIWNHVSSLYPPYSMSENLIEFADYVAFTSPVSYECQEIKKLSNKQKEKLEVIWSTVGVEDFKGRKRIEHEGFIVGYTGTVDFGKLNKDFIKLCSEVNIPNVKFIVCSGDSQQHLIDEAKEMGIYEKFSFEGRVPSVTPYLLTYDVFGYPLQPQHFATCEQSLGEAMMAGAVPVVLDNLTENYIVKHMETGMVAKTPDEYHKAIEYLYNNPDERKRMAKNAMAFAMKQYDVNQTIKQWSDLFEKVMQKEKREHFWNKEKQGNYKPYELYVESIGEYSKPLKDYIKSSSKEEKEKAIEEIKKLFSSNCMFLSKNKGSSIQYQTFFKDDKIIDDWAQIALKL